MAGIQSEYYKKLEKLVCEEYNAGVDSLRDVAVRLNTNHKIVKRYLDKNNIKIIKAKPKPMSDTTKKVLSDKLKGRKAWNKGLKTANQMPMKSRIENMRSHMRWNVDIDFLMIFDNNWQYSPSRLAKTSFSIYCLSSISFSKLIISFSVIFNVCAKSCFIFSCSSGFAFLYSSDNFKS